MPKMKGHSGIKKRFKINAKGQVVFRRSRRNHLLRKKSKKTKRHLRHSGILKPSEARRIKERLLISLK